MSVDSWISKKPVSRFASFPDQNPENLQIQLLGNPKISPEVNGGRVLHGRLVDAFRMYLEEAYADGGHQEVTSTFEPLTIE